MKMKKRRQFNWFFAASMAVAAVLLLLPQAGFSAVPTPGTNINAQNVDQYADAMPAFMVRMIKDGWGFVDPINIDIQADTPNGPPETYMAASQKNVAGVSLSAEGILQGWTNGMPFPDPKEPDLGLKCMWNQYHRWLGDDYTYDPNEGLVSCSQRKGADVSWGGLNWTRLKFEGRTDIQPVPAMDNPQGLYFAFHMATVGTGSPTEQLIYRYADPKKADDIWTYVPTLRRTLRMVSSDRSNPIMGSVKTWDDLFGFDGRVLEFKYEFQRQIKSIGLFNQKKLLNDADVGDHVTHPIFTKEPWEVKDVFVVKIIPVDPRYPNSHRFIWLPAEHFFPCYQEIFDKKGEFWKGNMNAFMRIDTKDGQKGNFMNNSCQFDVKTLFWLDSLFATVRVNSGVPKERFRLGSLGQKFSF
ncbi:MAG: DUF1329 domain-containing protein [Desulfobacteraceae bacterium]|nr:DUF1329 domain-containing protein [Desulfobacteraceae bacterium]MBU4053226.1 DUF1329 domain-containing protein [Pseudomonadota bacterium]